MLNHQISRLRKSEKTMVQAQNLAGLLLQLRPIKSITRLEQLFAFLDIRSLLQ